MPLARNVLKDILDAFEQRLQLITVMNGYDFDVGKIRRAYPKVLANFDPPRIDYYIVSVVTADNQGREVYTYEQRRAEFILGIEDKTRDDNHNDHAFMLADNVETALSRHPDSPTPADEPDTDIGGLAELFITRVDIPPDPASGASDAPYVQA